MKSLKPLIQWIIFPLYMSLALFSVLVLLRSGIDENIALFSVVIPFALGIALLERVLPYRNDWNKNDNDLKTDFFHAVIIQSVLPRLIKPLWILLLAPITFWTSQNIAFISWPHEWPLIAQLFLMLLIAEFGRYWVHRAAHEVPLLWRFHAVHHSPNRLYWLNAARFHPVEKVFFLIPELVPFIILQVGVETTALYFVFNTIHGLFQHGNVNVKLGPLNYIFSMAELHRWHHSKIIEQSDKNYGNNLIIWDIVFGTFYWPKGRQVARIGLFNPDYPKTYIGQLKAPFHSPPIDKPSDYYENKEKYEEEAHQEDEKYNRISGKVI